MLICVPVLVGFDVAGGEAAPRIDRAADKRMITMRYDTEKTDSGAEWSYDCPATAASNFQKDSGGFLFALFRAQTERAITERVEALPAAYAAAREATA